MQKLETDNVSLATREEEFKAASPPKSPKKEGEKPSAEKKNYKSPGDNSKHLDMVEWLLNVPEHPNG
jgi:hypothetical protein